MTSPKDSGNSGDASAVSGEAGTSESSAAADDGSSASSGADEKIVINSCEQEDVLKLEVSNQTGSFSFDRASREVSSTDDDGNVSTATQRFHYRRVRAQHGGAFRFLNGRGGRFRS